ncbi:hypothetical protein C8J57DRAFT_946040, partial [Mycena rebaudengoi]
IRCTECADSIQCVACCVNYHEWRPLHRVKEWCEGDWHPTTLADMGLIFQLGHSRTRCPHPCPKLRTISVIDVVAVHEVRYRFCGCDGAGNMLNQLLWNQWYPVPRSMREEPILCATFSVLD